MINVCIVGLGLMGGSLGKALKAFNKANHNKKYHIKAVARKSSTLAAALKNEAADEISLKLESAKDADIVVICVPVDLTVDMYLKLSKIVKSNTIITDVGSIKSLIEKEITKLNKKGNLPSFVGAHPMSGKETNGFFYSQKDLFEGANVVITGEVGKTTANMDPRLKPSGMTGGEKIVANMWKDAGANIIKMSAKKHDELVALTSHLPHLMAFALNKIYKDARKKDKQIEKIVAGSFYSAIRVASSSADMWAPIFSSNQSNIKNDLKLFIKALKTFDKTLKNKSKIKKEILKTQK